ncbi:bifunctional hydroxymethylpyrimidine kinase/phosphomethylpyrimidine kinase [Alicyclobacillus cycloheptanicus]|uniref:Hydroxymethylpyrimidine/phosphomethylpyrimidine kinase n=1 Tax=Alicyclobacillus cycloheptanicus TaxID=1457 RepID=A0ABT9XKV5_9BACL|nr:bifunctional hydroxymethylpyrimidine kinase/phosphomethylpyrimidine kinase [Alicyclobacillus cycloheptanicus]MDQ0190684.1 hydroxymethylpyrimidine/phosphomethylpyrimidine kinase [Alicyclobacillus cycloheptanicus]WDM00301.1 bifunctional hydroxymethylpyrimidine kinase/phosphomethylpyrimidine kinase [Alicyclobacillus cycloheptanicus]
MFRQPGGHVVRALTIAGSDSGGGAGIQADLKTLHQFGVYGMCAITALTAQNTHGVQDIQAVPASFVQQQLESVLTDLGADAVKTGMLASADIIHTVADVLEAHAVQHLVVDPVMVAKGGAPLLQPDAVDALKARLFPLAAVVTPNLPEAQALCGYPIRDLADAKRAARDLAQSGVPIVVIKGGHAADGRPNDAVDIIYDSGTQTFTSLVSPRVPSRKTHGTGCTFSSAVTALLARGEAPLTAIAMAKAFVFEAIDRAKDWDVGSGHGPTDHTAPANTSLLVPPAPLQHGSSYVYRDGTWTVHASPPAGL